MQKIALVCCLLLGIGLLSACGQFTPVPSTPTATAAATAATAAPAATATPTYTPPPAPTVTDTPSPTATFAPTLAPLPTIAFRPPADGLKTKGPYLVYARQANSQYPYSSNDPTILVAMDADASGQVTFTLPNLGYVARLSDAFSPDGKWLAYFTGSPIDPSPDGHYQFSLHIYNWRTGEDRKVADLLSSDYPNNFQKTLKMLAGNDPKRWESWDPFEVLGQPFVSGIYHPAWSPDGRYLAFAGEQDGPSSDLYLYVLNTSEIRRLTDGSANIDWLRWTPDSQKIFHHSAYIFGEGESGTYHVAQIDGKAWNLENVSTYGGGNILVGWVSNNQMALYSHANGPYGPLRYLNIDTGEEVIYFEGGVNVAAYDPVDKMWLVSSAPSYKESDPIGLYLVDPKTKSKRLISPMSCISMAFLGNQDERFAAACWNESHNDSNIIVHRDGTLTTQANGQIPIAWTWTLRRSPDNQWYIASDGFDYYLYDSGGKLHYQSGNYSGYGVKTFIWRPDSAGFFFLVPEEATHTLDLYYFSLSDHQITLIDKSLGEYEDWPFVWIK